MNIESAFKPGGEDVRIVVAHSTEDELGTLIATRLQTKLRDGVDILALRSIGTLKDLLDLLAEEPDFHVLILVGHGNEILNTLRLVEEKDASGNVVRVRAAELAVLNGHIDDKLILFGVCHFGSEDLSEAITVNGGALACVAPKRGATIGGVEVADGFANLINYMQTQKAMAFGVEELHRLLMPLLDKEFQPSKGKLLPRLKAMPER